MSIWKKKPTTADVDVNGADTGADSPPDASPQGKGRPTPKRADSQAANKRPLVPGDRKVAAKQAREHNKTARSRAYQGMARGEERYLPLRDRGPQKRYIRDYVDARRNAGENFLPAAFAMILLQFVTMAVQNEWLSFIVLIALYLMVVVALIDAFIMWSGLKRKLRAKFGDDASLKGCALYSVMRAFQLRRTRLPKPIHRQRGVWPS